MTYEDYKVTVPEGESGDWKVQRFTMTEHDEEIERLRSIFRGRGRFCPAGIYTRLTHGRDVIMSDTPDEIRDHRYFMEEARGNILINGLGLGMVLNGCLRNPNIAHATVIEISEDVIKLVGKHYQDLYGDRLTIIHADAMAWKPPKGVRYNYVWHDIWDSICKDNLKEMTRLHRRYGKIADVQSSWCSEECRRA